MAQKIPCKTGDIYRWNQEAAQMQTPPHSLTYLLLKLPTKVNDYNRLNAQRTVAVIEKLGEINKKYYEFGEDGKAKRKEGTDEMILLEGKTEEERDKEVEEYFKTDTYVEV